MDPTAWATFWAFMGLVAFLAVAVYYKVPGMITAALDGRTAKVRATLDDARRLRDEAQALLAEYQRRRGEAEAEAAAIVTQARREAEALAEEARIRLADFVTRRTKAVEQRIAHAETQAVAEVRGRAIDLATSAAGRVIAEKARGGVGDELVQSSIETVRARLN